MNRVEFATEIQVMAGNNRHHNDHQLFLYRAPKKSHETNAVRNNNSKIILSLNDCAYRVSKKILSILLGALSNNSDNEFLALPRIVGYCLWKFGLYSR
jgi:hypothetical protein